MTRGVPRAETGLPDVRPVRYHDGFQAGRFTKFCHRYNWIVRVQDGFEIDRKFSRYHEHGNDAD